MGRSNKNVVYKQDGPVGQDLRDNLYKEVVRDGKPFPASALSYEDIDKEFERWVREDLDITHDGHKLDTYVMYSNQRFSEFMQSWSGTDNKLNLFLHFKTLTREKSPKGGTIVDGAYNIPGDRWYTMKRERCTDNAGRPYYKSYQMKQPFAVDLNYKVSIVTNKIEIINEFNCMINDKFKSQQCYIRPCGHFVAMLLENITDESENDLIDRQYMAQTYQIKVLGYIIRQDDMRVIEEPKLKFDIELSDGDKSFGYTSSIEEYDDGTAKIETVVAKDVKRLSITPDIDIDIFEIKTDNIKYLDISINGVDIKCEVINGEVFTNVSYDSLGNITNKDKFVYSINDGDYIVVKNIVMNSSVKNGDINIFGNKR